MKIKGLKIVEKTKDFFDGWYKDHHIEIQRNTEDFESRDFYITVLGDYGYAYDGYWRDSEDKTIDEAITEALRGSELLTNLPPTEGGK